MITEYRRDMNHNYLVIHHGRNQKSGFHEQMIKYNKIPGLLSFETQVIDNIKYSYYEITGYQALTAVIDKKPLEVTELKYMVENMIKSIVAGKSYLLNESDYILSPDYLFINISNFQLKICYFPGYEIKLQKQICDFFEWLMNKINYKDQEAVLLMYTLYMKSKEEGCTLQDLMCTITNSIGAGFDDSIQEDKLIMNNVNCTSDTNNLHKLTAEKFSKVNIQEESSKDNFLNREMTKKESNYKKMINQKFPLFKLPFADLERITNKQKNKKLMYQEKAPFITQKLEEEQEKISYSGITYFLAVGALIIAISIIIIAMKEKLVYNAMQSSINPIKLSALLGICLVFILYCYLRLFGKGNQVSKFVQSITYDKPTMDYEEYPILSEQGTRKSLLEAIIKEGKDEYSVNNDMTINNEEKTVMLTDTFKNLEVKLVPVDKETYEVIRISEFPFFVGKLKIHMDYYIPSEAVSRYHAKIIKEEEEFYLMDLNSTNGTYVNGEQVLFDEKKCIQKGDEITFANVSYIFLN